MCSVSTKGQLTPLLSVSHFGTCRIAFQTRQLGGYRAGVAKVLEKGKPEEVKIPTVNAANVVGSSGWGDSSAVFIARDPSLAEDSFWALSQLLAEGCIVAHSSWVFIGTHIFLDL